MKALFIIFWELFSFNILIPAKSSLAENSLHPWRSEINFLLLFLNLFVLYSTACSSVFTEQVNLVTTFDEIATEKKTSQCECIACNLRVMGDCPFLAYCVAIFRKYRGCSTTQ